MANFEVAWEGPEFEYREKTVSWYWVSIVAAVLIVGFSVLTKNFLFGFFIVLAEAMFIILGNRVPRLIHFTLSESKLTVEGRHPYLLNEFESWSFEETHADDPWVILHFQFRSRIKVPIALPFPRAKFEETRANLRTVLKEVSYDPSFIDSIEKLSRF